MLNTALPSLAELENATEFQARHLGPWEQEQAHLLSVIGVASRQALMDGFVPASIHRAQPMDLPAPLTEAQALAELKSIAQQNKVMRNFIGQGYYGTHTPGVILRNILENPAWYTAYTPYQAEISQGRMEALVNFQTMVTDLTGLAMANASMLDEATAAAEAMTLAARAGKSKSTRFVVCHDVFPQTLEVIQTRALPLGITVEVVHAAQLAEHLATHDCFAALMQYPGVNGQVRDLRPLIDALHTKGALAIVAADLLALALLTPPGELGADIALGTTQRFGMPMGNGGPHAAYLATKDEFKRSMPGRLVGVSVDSHGNPAYRLALQTREQHIRREKATSNICTAQVLPAVIASMYAVYHGPSGLTRIAQRVAAYTAILAEGLKALGRTLIHTTYFDTLQVQCDDRDAIVAAAVAKGINLRIASADTLSISLDETSTRDDIIDLWTLFGGHKALPSFAAFEGGVALGLPAVLRRSSAFLTHPVFNTHHSETEMLRYLRALSDKDLALDRTMIPLGSCTMKLNATAEMEAISWPEFASIHPFAPDSQTEGWRELIAGLEADLAEITGYDQVSIQPNAGSQGELA
ncbi:MAG TPA: glycine dehydrogenase (aminomethyl-transferring), partial [Aquabacterium sp.]|nr:glycine dehydrogenase (aminomethyl-transferring) [Aquabacterium sp.]